MVLALPLLNSILPTEALGQSVQNKRFITLYLPHGNISSPLFYPNSPANIAISGSYGHSFHHSPLNLGQAPQLSRMLSAGLNPFLSKMNVIRGMDMPTYKGNHGDYTFLGQFHQLRSKWSGAPLRDSQLEFPHVASVDQFLAWHPKIYSATPATRSLLYESASSRLLINPRDPSEGTRGAAQHKTLLSAWNALFGGDAAAIDPAQRQNKKTLVDQVLNDLNAIKARRDISTENIRTVESFADEIHELQQKLDSTVRQCAGKGDAPADVSMTQYSSDSEREQFFDLYTSILAAGIKCGRTKVAVLKHPGNKDANANWHDWSHNDPHDAPYNHRQVVADNVSWIIESTLVPLLNKLDTPESEGRTFLDNSVVLFGSVNSGAHKQYHLPIMTVGSGGGAFRTGNYIDYRSDQKSDGHGVYYNQLLISIMMAMGLSPGDISANGNYAYSGVLPSGKGHSYANSVTQMAQNPLPFLWNGA